ncbi:hypothetical protein ACFU8R_13405 [Pseudonocardia alni]|uniref:hypothetical protein n=1 Tax=Pseudonocardia TaxID=1847 RepID=UPI00307DE20F
MGQRRRRRPPPQVTADATHPGGAVVGDPTPSAFSDAAFRFRFYEPFEAPYRNQKRAIADDDLSGTFSPVNPYLREFHHLDAPVDADAEDVLEIRSAGVGTVTVDPERAGVGCDARLDVHTDGPLTVMLDGCGRTESFDGRLRWPGEAGDVRARRPAGAARQPGAGHAAPAGGGQRPAGAAAGAPAPAVPAEPARPGPGAR